MIQKKLNITFEYDYDFFLIGICCPLRCYQLCYHLNKINETSLYRCQSDLSMNGLNKNESGYFPIYEFWDEKYQNQWYLISNKSQIIFKEEEYKGTIFDGLIEKRKQLVYLIPENQKVDYYLQVHGIYGRESKLQLLKKINNHNRIVSAYEINVEELQSKENLIIK